MKVRVGRHIFAARIHFAETHGIWLIEFGPVMIQPAHVGRVGGVILEATAAERNQLLAQGCPIEAIAPDRVAPHGATCEELPAADFHHARHRRHGGRREGRR